jgi:pimeloyl-ACP methyl ester carboxylesterase
LLHGIRMDRRPLAPVAVGLLDRGFRVLLPDLRGHGASSGRYLTYGEVEARDVSQMLDALAIGSERPEPVGVFGFSYGASVALQVSAQDPRVRAVVAVAAFSTLREVVNDYRAKYLPEPLKFVPPSWFQSALDDAGRIAAFDPDRAGPARSLERSHASVLLLHGDKDTQVPPRHSRALSSLAGGRAELRIVANRAHDDVLGDPRVRDQAVTWFEQRLDDRP